MPFSTRSTPVSAYVDPKSESIMGETTNKALKQELDESKAEVDAAQTRIKDLEESTCDLEKKLQDAVVQKQQITNELHTLEAKNRETLERIREVEQELSNSEAKTRELEAKFDQTDMGQVIAVMKEKVDKLENGEISRLKNLLDDEKAERVLERQQCEIDAKRMTTQLDAYKERILKKDMEVAKLSNENAKIKRDLSDSQKRLTATEKRIIDTNREQTKLKRDLSDTKKRLTESERRIVDMGNESAKAKREFSDSLEAADKRIADMIKEKEEMAEEMKSWEHLRQLLEEATEYAEGIGKKKAESRDKQSSQDLIIPPRLVPRVPPAAWKRRNFWILDSESNGDSAKKARIDIQNKPEESGAKNATNVASGSKAVVI
ncbi:laminin-like protein epi-1 [Ditylenchus destructor]|uniref:Laminin-like protein epi-1 n=1 Tax=Ditylenchus destructor TaxID=166010 RepID=A0AAD4MLQ9_9BILA|nr:laminin-like protein epi-1 [Ditylenchus destructor]